ncbi:MAG: hypothetical protein JWQ89_4245 [Devosia sp.]|uniref:DUF1150 family protein n=1 Tax=Devosia sp. TaxID=1871048 RepID=UPI002618C627|nr:DUF1150 family protein [Devosia sp.]MDB5542518.1 hypothetical protein [Devosia sp.]
MQDWHDDIRDLSIEKPAAHPLKDLTPAEFQALGGDDLVYVRQISGAQLAQLLGDPDFDEEEQYQLVVSADCRPLLVADSAAEAQEWLAEQRHAVVSLH